jgi:hypothetical protein
MILGVHNMVDALTTYWDEHLSADGAWWILGLDAILLIPAIFAVFFYPLAVGIGVAAAVALAAVYYVLLRALQKHRVHA